MKFKKLLLLSASLVIGLVGIAYLLFADTMYARYGIEIFSVNEYSMVRGAYGGLFLSFSLIFLSGAIDDRFELLSLTALFTFMLGFALGRLVSIFLDGIPSDQVLSLLAFELVCSIASLYFIRRQIKWPEARA